MFSYAKQAASRYPFWVACLTLIGFLVRLYMAHIDPFLHIWDERFHALVARNMMEAPLMPILRNNAIFPSDFHNWTQAGLWLHKPPLFLWQMAVSMKIFGATEYAARYPSVIMGTLMIPMVFFIVKEISRSEKIAFLTSVLFCFSNFHLELVAGIRSMDHNDIALEFYVLASIWAFIKYQKKQRWYWLVLTGVFSGAAILCKWLVGLFVFCIWGFKIMFGWGRQNNVPEIIKLLVALGICCIIFLPWQWYIFHYFPNEAAYEYQFNNRHITEALEGHSGSIFFYLERLPGLFGEGLFLLIFPGMLLFMKSKEGKSAIGRSVLCGLLFVFLFFSLVVKTKVVSHIYFAAPLAMMLIAYSIVYILVLLKNKMLRVILLAGFFVLNAKPEKILMDQYVHNEQRLKDMHNAMVYKSLGRKIPEHVKVIVNIPDWVSCAFYNKDKAVYETLSEEQVNVLKERKVRIGVFAHVKGFAPLPAYISSYPYLTLIDETIE